MGQLSGPFGPHSTSARFGRPCSLGHQDMQSELGTPAGRASLALFNPRTPAGRTLPCLLHQ
eukprot:5941986-Alexandrium_andersonii.AAC.1